MRIFLDANILVTVLCNEYPQITFCGRILSLADNADFEVYTSPLCLAISYYFAEKKNGNAAASKKIHLLSEKLQTTTMDNETVKKTVTNKAVKDFEDGLQYYSAVQAKCKCIITQNKKDFHFSSIEVLNAEEFLMAHVVKKKTN